MRDVLAKISQNVGFPTQLQDGWHHVVIDRVAFTVCYTYSRAYVVLVAGHTGVMHNILFESYFLK